VRAAASPWKTCRKPVCGRAATPGEKRDEARDDSDLDILVDFEGHPTFLSYMGLRAYLADAFGRRVDLVSPDALKPRPRPTVEREAVDVGQAGTRLTATFDAATNVVAAAVVRVTTHPPGCDAPGVAPRAPGSSSGSPCRCPCPL
jgi:predicted nucleotidyltransferase